MDGRIFHRTLISDDGVCNVRDLGPEGLRLVGHEDATFPDDLDGRYRFWLHGSAFAAAQQPDWDPEDARDGRFYATLRVDAEHAMISGDLFSDIRRTDWRCSWRSEAIFAPPDRATPGIEWDLLAICDLFRSDTFVVQGEAGASLPEKLALFLRTGKGHLIKALRLIAMDTDGNAALDLSMTETEQPVHSRSFRHLNIVNVTDIDPEADDLLSRVMLRAVGRDGTPLREVLNRTGARLYNGNSEQIVLRYCDRASDSRAPEIGDTAFSLLSPYQWTDDPYGYAVLLTRLPPPDDAILGTTFGLDGKEPLHRPRFGAVVYVKKVVDSYLKRRDLAESAATEEDIDNLARRIRFTYLHELGHLLNLPHPWQRDMFHSPGLAAEPAARSWMNYGSLYPLGDFMRLLRRRAVRKIADPDNRNGNWRLERELALAKEDADRSNSSMLAEPGFTPAEQRWLWHAPFDQIASGGQYYTMPTSAPLILSNQTSPQLKLTIWDGTGPDDTSLRLRRRPAGGILWQPLLGQVEFTPKADFVRRHPFHMTFQSPMLVLLIRCEDTRNELPYMLPETRRVAVAPLPLGWADADEKPLRDSDLARHLHAKATDPFTIGKESTVYRATLPLVTGGFLGGFRNDWKDQFTVQAVLRPYGSAPIFSNRVAISYGNMAGGYSTEEAAIMAHPRLPLLIELLSFRTDTILSELRPPLQHSDGYHDPAHDQALKGLIKAIIDVKPGPVSPQLLSYCKERLAWSADGDAHPELRSVDDRTDGALIRQYLTRRDDLMESYGRRILTT